jgi:hypothetical protein
MVKRGRHLELISPTASPEEAAAVVAALEQFMRATAPLGSPRTEEPDLWKRAAILEGLSRADSLDARDPWINP